FARYRVVDRRSLGPLKQVRHVAGGHVVGGLAVDRGDDVSRVNARAISRSAGERRNYDDLIVPWTDGHSYAVVLATLVFAQQRIRLGIKKVRVRVEHMEHARNGPVVNGFVRVYRLGIILLHDVIDLRELAQALTDIGVAVVGCRRVLLGKYHPQKPAKRQK